MMILKSLVFALIVFGLAMVIAFAVAAIVKVIALVVQRKQKSAPAENAKS